jgi:D-sedoheptulose 7-phosphate isomerase
MKQFTQFSKFAREYVDMCQAGLDFETIWHVADVIYYTEGRVYLVGNGGSASLADHMAVDLQLAGVDAVALTSGVALSSYGNDFGVENMFARQLQHVGVEDTVILISTSGRSQNILNAYQVARENNAVVVTLTGKDGGELFGKGDYNIHVNCKETGPVQDLHQIALHVIAYWLMQEKKG